MSSFFASQVSIVRTMKTAFLLILSLIFLLTNAEKYYSDDSQVTQLLLTLVSDFGITNTGQLIPLLELGNFLRDVAHWRGRNKPAGEYLGCFDEGKNDRGTTYRGYMVLDGSHMSNEHCVDLCRKQRFAYAATQAG